MNDLISRQGAIDAPEAQERQRATQKRRYTFGNDEFSLEAAYHDCKLVFDGITDDDSFQEADTGLILYYANEIIYALHEALEGKDTYVPINDCVSRQAIFDTAAEYENELCEILGDENELVEVVKILKHRLIALPSVQSETHDKRTETHACDLISRQAAIEVAKQHWYKPDIAGALAELPSVQPDNSCDGCRYENADDGVLVSCGFCKRSHPDNYERRTDEQTD